MASFTQACKICGLILTLIVALKMFRFGSFAIAQESCWCSLSCDEAEAELKKHTDVEVHVEHKSKEIYNKIHEVSSLFNKEGRCSVVVEKCLKNYEEVELRMFPDNKNQPIYEKMDLKPECETETTPKERSGAGTVYSITILLIIGFFVALKFRPRN